MKSTLAEIGNVLLGILVGSLWLFGAASGLESSVWKALAGLLIPPVGVIFGLIWMFK